MTDEAVIQGSYADLKLIKTRKVAVVCIEIPIERVPDLIQKFGMPDYGAEVPVAVARLDEKSVSQNHFVERTDTNRPKSYAQRAGILSNDPAFWAFVAKQSGMPVTTSEDAAQRVRTWCGVRSRRDIIEGTEAGRRFKDLLATFEAWKLVA